MWKKLFEILLKKILIPILREILIFIFKELLKKLFIKLKALLIKWREREKEQNPENANNIDKKYDEYQKDLDTLEKELCDDIPNIISEGIEIAEKKGNELLEEHKPKQIKQKNDKDTK